MFSIIWVMSAEKKEKKASDFLFWMFLLYMCQTFDQSGFHRFIIIIVNILRDQHLTPSENNESVISHHCYTFQWSLYFLFVKFVGVNVNRNIFRYIDTVIVVPRDENRSYCEELDVLSRRTCLFIWVICRLSKMYSNVRICWRIPKIIS